MMILKKTLIATIFSILYALLQQNHIQSYILNNYKVIGFSVNFSNCQFGIHVLEYYLGVTVHLNIQLT
jgi:hypothetical protein